MKRWCVPAAALAGTVYLASAGTLAQVPRVPVALPEGYLADAARLDGTILIPPPPQKASPAMTADRSRSEQALALADGPRWQLARRDAEIRPPDAVSAFSCATGIDLREVSAPHLIGLLTRSSGDLARASARVKALYRRPRPFMVNDRPSCTPERDAFQRDGSYPSGHAAIGWGWALILSELIPDRAERILARGRSFGDSRVVCNVHWQSDVEEGRILGAATVARLHADPRFNADLAEARLELAAMPTKPSPKAADCLLEAQARTAGTQAIK